MGPISVSRAEPTDVGKILKEMVVEEGKDEENAIDTYKGLIALAQKEGNVKAEFIFMKIFMEDDFHGTFTILLEQIQDRGSGKLGFE